MLKIAVLTPMPKASDSTARAAKPGSFRSRRTPKRRSCHNVSIKDSQRASGTTSFVTSRLPCSRRTVRSDPCGSDPASSFPVPPFAESRSALHPIPCRHVASATAIAIRLIDFAAATLVLTRNAVRPSDRLALLAGREGNTPKWQRQSVQPKHLPASRGRSSQLRRVGARSSTEDA